MQDVIAEKSRQAVPYFPTKVTAGRLLTLLTVTVLTPTPPPTSVPGDHRAIVAARRVVA